MGAVLGTALLVAIVGDPIGLAAALSVSDTAYLFAVFASLVAGVVTLALRPAAETGDEKAAEAALAPAASRSG